MYLEIRMLDDGQMVAEGSSDDYPDTRDIDEVIEKRGWCSTGLIDLFHDDMQKVWRFSTNVEKTVDI